MTVKELEEIVTRHDKTLTELKDTQHHHSQALDHLTKTMEQILARLPPLNDSSSSNPQTDRSKQHYNTTGPNNVQGRPIQLHDVYDPNKINVKIKIVSGSPCGVVAAEAKKIKANWVVLDKQLKQEEKRCMDELQCNIVVMKKSQPKVLRLNLVGSPKKESEVAGQAPSTYESFETHSTMEDANHHSRLVGKPSFKRAGMLGTQLHALGPPDKPPPFHV